MPYEDVDTAGCPAFGALPEWSPILHSLQQQSVISPASVSPQTSLLFKRVSAGIYFDTKDIEAMNERGAVYTAVLSGIAILFHLLWSGPFNQLIGSQNP